MCCFSIILFAARKMPLWVLIFFIDVSMTFYPPCLPDMPPPLSPRFSPNITTTSICPEASILACPWAPH